MKKIHLIYFILLAGIFVACNKEDDANYVPEVITESTDPIDVYFRENFLQVYETAVRWKWDDKLVDNSKRVTPARREFCVPMGEFIKRFWLEPFQITQAGTDFMADHFPPEIVFIGSPMYNSDGQSITLGYADAGVRITFTQVNEYDLKNRQWLLLQLRTAEHEYAHIVHQRHNLPNGFKEVSPANYKSNNWLNLAGDVQAYSPRISREAISLGMVTNYGTSDENEDFCEILSIYITSASDEFNERYIWYEIEESYTPVDEDGNDILDDEGNPIVIEPFEDAVEVNAGRDIIALKLKMIKDYYMEKFQIDLDAVRDEIVKRIDEELNND